jgi:hypothetical protein
MQMSDCLRSTQQQPTVPAIRQGKDLDGFVSGVGCQVFHGISGF